MHPGTRSIRKLATISAGLCAATLLTAACATPDAGDEADSAVTAFEGARLVTGDGAVIEEATFLVEADRFTHVGASADVEIPAGALRVDLGGSTVMPAIVNAHMHLEPERTARTSQLQHLAYYGVGAAVSLGHDDGDAPFDMRHEIVPDGARSMTAGRGITAPEPGRSDVPFWITTEEEARAAVQELASRQVDIIKIWVDDRGGQYDKLSPALYGPIIDEAHQHGLMVTVHVFYLDDAKGLLRAGVDAFAHGIRDLDVDDELVELWTERPDVVLVPNLPGPGVALDLGWLSGTIAAAELQQMQEGSVDRPAAQESFGIQARSLARLHQAGVKIAFGTDGGAAWAAHQEMEDMVRSGMSPADVIVAATSSSAELMGWDDVGLVAAGKSADFVVLDANPLDDITNTRRIESVYLRGTKVDRQAIGSRLKGETP